MSDEPKDEPKEVDPDDVPKWVWSSDDIVILS